VLFQLLISELIPVLPPESDSGFDIFPQIPDTKKTAMFTSIGYAFSSVGIFYRNRT
jgi:hypothetical protein